MAGNVSNNMSHKYNDWNQSVLGSETLMTPAWMAAISTLTSIGIIGNSFVVVLILGNKSLRRNINYFIVNLAVSDAAILVVLLLRALKDFDVFHLYERPVNPVVGNVLCRLSFFLDSCQQVSLLTLLILSINRFQAVSKPFLAAPTTTKVRSFLILATWTFSALLYFNKLALQSYKWEEQFKAILCPSFFELEALKVFYFIQIACLMLVFVVILVLNVTIICKLRKSRNNVPSLPTAQEQIRGRRIANAIKMILCSLTLYIVMWSPHHIENLLHVVSPSFYEHVVDWSWFNILSVCLALNSTLSPLIYFVFIKEFRSVLRKTIPLTRNSTDQ